jgi:cysteine-rich repeat protein
MRYAGMVAAAAITVVLMVVVLAGPACGNGVREGRLPDSRLEECDDGNLQDGDGCSSLCRVEFPTKIYVAHYLGNIDGGFSEDWFFFYGMLDDHFREEQFPVGATVYPASIDDAPEFAPYIKRLYENPYVELVQKGDTGNETEQRMDSLNYSEQYSIIRAGQDTYRRSMAEVLGVPEDEVILPLAYNQPQGRFTNTTRQVLEDLDFTIFFEMYLNEDIGPIESSEDVDVLQYGVGFTRDGGAGRDTEFFQPGEFLLQLRNFNRVDLNMLHINGSRVVPIWVHHMDFERKDKPNRVDLEKWSIYRYVIERIKEEPNLVLVSPQDIWEMRHAEG